jgi:hypothetical protein
VNFRHISFTLVITALSLSAVLPSALGVVRRDDRKDSDYRRAGNQAAFNRVGRVEIDYGNGFETIGTATLYGTDRIVSAAHVFDSDTLSGAIGVRINFGHGQIRTIDFLDPGVVNLNPGYNPNTLRNDVSVVFLAQSFTLAPARLYRGKKIKLETTIRFVGYGDTGTGKAGSNVYSSRKRAGDNALGRYLGGGKSFEVDFDSPATARFNSLGSSKATELEGLLGSGDSGGSVWMRKGGRWRLIGINSYGLDWYPHGSGNGIDDDYGDRSGFVYLPRYTDWMDSLQKPSGLTVQGNASRSLAAVPEPSTVLLLAAGAAVWLIFGRRRLRS